MTDALLDTTAVVLLLVINAFFVSAEFALLASRRSRITALADDGNRAAAAALASLRELSLTMAGAQLGITLASLALGAVAEPTIAHGLEGLLHRTGMPGELAGTLGLGVGLAVVTLAHTVLGELAPKSWAMSHPEQSALLVARPFRLFTVALRPVIFALNTMANAVVRLLGQEPQNELALAHAPADLSLLLDESVAHGLPNPTSRSCCRARSTSTRWTPRLRWCRVPTSWRSTPRPASTSSSTSPAGRGGRGCPCMTASWTRCAASCTSRTCWRSRPAPARRSPQDGWHGRRSWCPSRGRSASCWWTCARAGSTWPSSSTSTAGSAAW